MRLFSAFEITPADARLLPEGRLAGPMPWVIAVMIFLTVLAAASGLALMRASQDMQQDLAGQVTIQLMEANPTRQAAQAEAIETRLASLDGVMRFHRLSDAEIAKLLAPWFGKVGLGPDLPMPMLIDVALDPKLPGTAAALRIIVQELAPTARIEQHAEWLGPLVDLMRVLTWLASLLVLLMAGATMAVVVLAARSALTMHRPTIEVMHLLGATDGQIARLFQRRIGMDALLGAAIGFALGLVALVLVDQRASAIGSGLLSAMALGWLDGVILLAIPVITAVSATLAARTTLLLALRRLL